MRSRYLSLLASVMVIAILLAALGRMPHRAPALPPAAPPPPAESLLVEIRDGQIVPSATQVGLGHRLALTLRNHGSRRAEVRLSGYEHEFAAVVLAPGETLQRTLVLDLPGEDFAWLVDGRPVARLRVAGSHLVEGHR